MNTFGKATFVIVIILSVTSIVLGNERALLPALSDGTIPSQDEEANYMTNMPSQFKNGKLPQVSGNAKQGEQLEYLSSTLWTIFTDVINYGDYTITLSVNGLLVFDKNSLTTPLARLPIGLGYEYDKMILRGTTLFVSRRTEYYIVDIADPLNPVTIGIGSANPPETKSIDDTNAAITKMEVIGNRLYLGCIRSCFNCERFPGLPRFQIHDITDLTSPKPIGVYSESELVEGYSNGYDFVVADSLVYIICNDLSLLEVVSIADEAYPVQVSQSDFFLSARFWSIARVDNLLYIVGDGGIDLVNIDNPTSPIFTSHIDNGGGNFTVFQDSDNLFVRRYSGIDIYSIADPEAPVFITTALPDPEWYYVWHGAKVVDKMLYLPSNKNGFSVYDINNIYNPILRQDYQSPTWQLSGVAASGNWAYTTQPTSPGNWGDALHVVLVGDGTNVQHTVSVPAAGNSVRAEIVGNTLAVSGGGTGMFLYDVTYPWSPVRTGPFARSSYHISLKSDLAFISASGITFDIYDISDITAPTFLTDLHADRFSKFSILSGDYIYILEDDLYWSGPVPVSYLRTVDVSNPSDPTPISEFVVGTGNFAGVSMAKIGNYMYILMGYPAPGLKIVDISNQAEPVTVGNYTLLGDYPYDIYHWGHYIFVSLGSPMAVAMYDIAEPLNPILVDYIQFATRPGEITTSGNKLITATDGGLFVHQINVQMTCGDSNFDGQGPNIVDLTFVVNYLFRGGDEPAFQQLADVNGDGALDITDITYFVDYLFRSGLPLNCSQN